MRARIVLAKLALAGSLACSVACGSEDSSGGASGAAGSNPDGQAGAGGWSTVRVEAPPSYLGTVDDAGGCNHEYVTAGFEPVDPNATRRPLFLYFIGTIFVATDQSARYDSDAPRAVTEAMARRGFVALSVQYDNSVAAWLSDHVNQLDCLYGPANARSLLAAACALPQVDCDLGIATWGHSQGALVAHRAAIYDARVRASWATGYGTDAASSLAPNRFRVLNGEADGSNGTPAVLNQVAGFGSDACAEPAKECLRPDGSGWIIVQKSELRSPELSTADHCWFDRRRCADPAIMLEPNWVDAESTKAFALEPNADWVARTAQTP